MAYKPNPDRKVVNGKAVVSAKELADFQAERGSDKTLRDLLNADKGLSRKKESEDIQKSTDALSSKSRQSGPPTTTQGATYPKEEAPKPKARSLVDQGRGVQLYKDVDKEDVLEAGLALASMYPVVRGAKMAYTAARPAIGAAIKRLEDRPSPSFLREKEQPLSRFDTLTPENQAASQAYRNAYDDRPGPMKKGGAVKPYTKGGKINLGACGVSTHVPSNKNANW
jgi:hypothetical protein